MRRELLLISILLTTVWVFSGCALRKTASPRGIDQPSAAERLENSYYFYTEAQLQKKRGDLASAIQYMRQTIDMDSQSLYLKRELASLYIDLKEHENALGVLEEILEKNPEDLETLVLYGNLNQRLKQFDTAKDAYEKIISSDPKRENIYTDLGRIYMSEDDLNNALRVFKQQVDHFPASIVGHFYLGKISAKQGNFEQAEAAFEKTLALEPDLLESRFELIDILRSKKKQDSKGVTLKEGETIGAVGFRLYGRYDAAVEKAILKANPELKSVHEVRVGQTVHFPRRSLIENEGRDVETEERIIGLYQSILKKNSGNVRAAIELGLFYDEIGREADAEKILKNLGHRSINEQIVLSTAIQLYFEKQRYRELKILLNYMLLGAPESFDLFYVSGLNFNELDEKELAIKQFERVRPPSRFYENAIVNLALIYQEQKKIDKAIAHLEAASEKVPNNPEFKLYLGTLYEEKKAYATSEKLLKQGLEIEPENPKLHFRLGVVYDKWGKKDDCIASMKTAIRLDPQHASALNYLGYTYADLGQNLDEAEELIQRALEQKPDDGYITDSLGWVYYKKGLFQKALELILKAVALVSDDPIILEHLGDVYLKLDNREKALESYKRSLENKKEDKAVIEKKIQDLQETAARNQ